MNELLFFFQIGVVILLSLLFLQLGREAITTFIVLNSVFANFFVLKQTFLFGLHVTCSDVFAISSVLSLNLLQERYGKAAALKAIFISFFSLVFFAIVSQMHLFYAPSPTDTVDIHYHALLSSTPRLLLASLFAFVCTQLVDYRLFGWLKRAFPRLSWKLRASFSLILSQMVDTLLFSFLGLYGLVESMTSIVLFSFTIKLLILILMTFLSPAPKEEREASL